MSKRAGNKVRQMPQIRKSDAKVRTLRKRAKDVHVQVMRQLQLVQGLFIERLESTSPRTMYLELSM